MNRSLTDTNNAHNVRVDVFAAQMRALSRDERDAISHELDRQNVAELERSAIARRIKQARQEAGLSQPEMAEALGVISRAYQNYESIKKPRVPWGSMNDIAKITGKSTEWLIHGDRPTPDLLGAVREEQVSDHLAQEIRANREAIMAVKSLLETQQDLLEAQTRILKRMEAVAAGLPHDDTLRALTDAARQLEAIAEADEEDTGGSSAEAG